MDASRWQNLGYLFWAYTLFWILLAAYLLRLGSRVSRLQRELDQLKRGKDDGPPG